MSRICFFCFYFDAPIPLEVNTRPSHARSKPVDMFATSSTPLRRQAVSMHLSIDTLTTSWTIHSYSIKLAYQRYRSMTMALCQTGIVCIGHCAFTLLASSPDRFFLRAIVLYFLAWQATREKFGLVATQPTFCTENTILSSTAATELYVKINRQIYI